MKKFLGTLGKAATDLKEKEKANEADAKLEEERKHLESLPFVVLTAEIVNKLLPADQDAKQWAANWPPKIEHPYHDDVIDAMGAALLEAIKRFAPTARFFEIAITV